MKIEDLKVGKKYLISFTKDKCPGYTDASYYEGTAILDNMSMSPKYYDDGVYRFLIREGKYGYFSIEDIVNEVKDEIVHFNNCFYNDVSKTYHFFCQYRVENKNIDPLRLCSLASRANGWLISEMNRIIKPYRKMNCLGKDVFKNLFYITLEDNILCFNSIKTIEARKS